MKKVTKKDASAATNLRQPLGKVSEEDFQEHVWGRKALRKRKILRALKYIFGGILLLGVIAASFVGTETLLRVSELPPEHTSFTKAVQSTQTEQSPATHEGEPLQSFYVPLSMLDKNQDAAVLIAQAKQLGSSAAVITMKDSGGYLSYRSNLIQQRRINASIKARYRTDWTIKDLRRKAGQKIVGVIHCFDDPLAAGAIPEASVLRRDTDNTPWTDDQNRRWLNPYSTQAREYLTALIREVAAMDVDYILLRGVTFPSGNLQAAVFAGQTSEDDPAEKNKALRDFIAEAKEAAGKAKLYVMIPGQAAIDGSEALGGNLWGCAADAIAIDTRGAPWAKDDAYWKTQTVVPVVEAVDAAQGAQTYIVLEDEAQG